MIFYKHQYLSKLMSLPKILQLDPNDYKHHGPLNSDLDGHGTSNFRLIMVGGA